MIKLLTINGPIGSGKTWVADRIQERYPYPFTKRVNIQDILAEMIRLMFNVPTTLSSDEFKRTEFFGITGRAWMIQLSESMKELRKPVWVELALSKMQEQIGTVYIIDSQGFPYELEFLRRQVGIDLLSVSIEPPGCAPRGQRYQQDDSRINCADLCDVRSSNSELMLIHVIDLLLERNWIQRSL